MGGPIASARVGILLAALVCLTSARPKAPQTPEQKAEQDARRLQKYLDTARTDFKLGDYDKAVKQWKLAYKLQPLPPILFNIAQAQRLGHHFEDAYHSYQGYLSSLPDAANRAEVKKRIETMKRYMSRPPKFAKQAEDAGGK